VAGEEGPLDIVAGKGEGFPARHGGLRAAAQPAQEVGAGGARAATRSASWSPVQESTMAARIIRATKKIALTRNARATSAVERPHTSRRVSATWVSRDNAR
jgi:hypothetical protein